ncbi:cyclase family protein [Rutstroemia sp. NJR-2017a WRK4]|nr:cyclase family protein [Rutstroemia sp. NJR-2017a WRK4]
MAGEDTLRYDPSIYDTPFSKLPNPKRVWIGEPGSALEGIGRLSLLTPTIVSAAATSEIKTGQRVGLGWDMTKLEYSQFGRQKCGHKIVPLWGPGGSGYGACFDDVYHMNPQQSSQWDGFRHYSQPLNPSDLSTSQDRVFYGGTTKEEILDPSNKRIGLQHWASEGIAGRGILIDYHHYCTAQTPPIEFSNFSTHAISLATLKTILSAQNTQLSKGDILFIRMGVIPEWDSFSDEQKRAYAELETPQHAGVEASLELLEWLWDEGISAVAGDAISWEVFPMPGEISCHEYLLGGWGMPIGMFVRLLFPFEDLLVVSANSRQLRSGEIFDLEALSQTCRSLNRYSFFVTSMPLNMPGGVSSPPNAMAIF